MTTILVVDDHDSNRLVLSKLLTHAGYTVIEAEDGEAGLERVRTEHPDLALVDLLMPAVDGFEFVHRLRQDDGPHSRTPVVFITAAYFPSEVVPLAEACGVSYIVTRPATFEEILGVVEAALRAGPRDFQLPPQRNFRLELLRLLSDKVSQNVRQVLPEVAKYLEG